jgi:5-methylcytosine-specific restriction protein A
MPSKPLRLCNHPGCNELVTAGYCDKHKKQDQQQRDQRRGTAHERGYTYRWQKYSQWFLKQPENIFCKLQLPGCTNLAECVDHIDPVNGAKDPRFWDTSNHQGACIHCNSVKGHRKMIGKAEPFEATQQGCRGEQNPYSI